jgi:SRSO17 transposase
MSLLDHPEAQALLAESTVSAADVRGCRDRIIRFLQRYLPLFYREEQRQHAAIVVRGLLSDLERKTAEPIARQAGVPRKNTQYFVGCGLWDDEAVTAEARTHVREELADPRAVLVIDPSAFPKKGDDSCGVARQWCGRLGKTDNCQVGVFLAYAAPGGHAPLDRRLYLPEDWAADPERRKKCHVPEDVAFQEKWRIALDLLDRSRSDLPHAWVAADDEFGRVAEFRAALRQRGERYVLDVPCNTTVRDLDGRRPPRKKAGVGRKRAVPFRRADAWAARQPAARWTRLTIRAGAKGPREVEVLVARVRAKQERRIGPEERLLVVRALGAGAKTDYALTNAPGDVPPAELVRARSERHRIEQVFQEAKGEAGLAHYEVRSWVGWHHHVTLSLLALWFLCLERRRVGGEKARGDGGADAGDLLAAAPQAPSDCGRDCRGGQPGAAA